MVDVYNLNAEKTSQIELNDKIFGVNVRKDILHQVVVSQLSKRRSNSARVKTRSEVRASGSKLYRQKGTGRSRAGTYGSPTRRGGGVAFGPTLRSYNLKVPKKVKKAAISMALTDKLNSDHLVVIDDFTLPDIKTREFVRIMENFEVKKVLIVLDEKNENLEKSSRNVPWVKVMRYEGLNVYDILNYDHLILVKPAIDKIEEALAP